MTGCGTDQPRSMVSVSRPPCALATPARQNREVDQQGEDEDQRGEPEFLNRMLKLNE
jgi:hypothetical protein